MGTDASRFSGSLSHGNAIGGNAVRVRTDVRLSPCFAARGLLHDLPIHLWLTATCPTLVSNLAYPDSCPKTCCKNGNILCYTTATALNPHEVDMYPRLVNLIRLVWLLAVAWYELGTFYHHTASCLWPDEHFAALVRSHLHPSNENSLKQRCMLSRTLPMYSLSQTPRFPTAIRTLTAPHGFSD